MRFEAAPPRAFPILEVIHTGATADIVRVAGTVSRSDNHGRICYLTTHSSTDMEDVTYSLTTAKERNFLCVRATGRRTAENIASMAGEIVEECRKQNLDRVLVDVRELEGHLTIFESFMIPAKLFPRLKDRHVINKAVIVDSEKNKERLRFFESVARARDFDVRTFEDPDKAREWISEDVHVAAL
jgi:hypothetical protein